MISREEAERILEKPAPKPSIIDRIRNRFTNTFKDWYGDVPILNYPEIASKVLTEDSLFVVHFGYHYDYRVKKYRWAKYNGYVKKLKAKLKSVLGKKTVLIWTAFGYKESAIRFLGVDRNSVVLVPTKNDGLPVIENILKMKEDQFYRKLSEYVKTAELTGEYSNCCVPTLGFHCRGLIRTHIITHLSVPYKRRGT